MGARAGHCNHVTTERRFRVFFYKSSSKKYCKGPFYCSHWACSYRGTGSCKGECKTDKGMQNILGGCIRKVTGVEAWHIWVLTGWCTSGCWLKIHPIYVWQPVRKTWQIIVFGFWQISGIFEPQNGKILGFFFSIVNSTNFPNLLKKPANFFDIN